MSKMLTEELMELIDVDIVNGLTYEDFKGRDEEFIEYIEYEIGVLQTEIGWRYDAIREIRKMTK